ncbi:MAG: leucine-rich repeat protein [Bacteroidales bacterium]|nr:leucine-rich repeat protein [Bacteroidales bacterium]
MVLKKIFVLALTIVLATGLLSAQTVIDSVLYIDEGTTKIVTDAFNGRTDFNKVVIPQSVTKIQGNAFFKCENLREVVIPDEVTSMGQQIFWGCKSLEKVNLPTGISEIPLRCFQGCTSLKTIEIPDNITAIGSHAFYNSGIEQLTIPESVTSIGKNALNTSSLKTIEIPESVTELGELVFNKSTVISTKSEYVQNYVLENDYQLADSYTIIDGVLVVREGIKTIPENMFRGNREITEIRLPLSCEKICQYAFAEMPFLKKISGLDNVKTIERSVFYKCWNLTEVSTLKTVESIGINAFKHCTRLRSMYVPATLTSIGSEAFYGNTTIIAEENTFVRQWLSDAANCPHFTILTKLSETEPETDSRNIDFFCETGWSQSDFLLNAIPSPGVERLGCWCTAFSQMLYNLKVVPAGTTDYLYKNYGTTTTVNFDAEPIDFSKILTELDGNASTDEKLMTSLYCWYCLATMGAKHNSSAFRNSLETYYPIKTSQIYSSAGREQVEAFLLEHLQKNQIVMAYREGSGTGHAMCIDGIRFVNDITYVHFNWGWGHTSDGWYNLWDVWNTAIVKLDDASFYLMGIEKSEGNNGGGNTQDLDSYPEKSPIHWKSGDFTTDWDTYIWKFNNENLVKGENLISFTYSEGNTMSMKDAEIYADGKLISFDETEYTADQKQTILYNFTLGFIPEQIIIKAQARTNDGINSSGTIGVNLSKYNAPADKVMKFQQFKTVDGLGVIGCYTNIPLYTEYEQIERLVINCHGSPPSPDDFFKTAYEQLASYGSNCLRTSLIVAPWFYSKATITADWLENMIFFAGEQSSGTSNSMLIDNTEINLSAFDYLDQIIKYALSSGDFPNIKEIWVMGMSAGGRLMQRYSMLNAVQNNYPTIEFKYVCKAIPDYLHPNEEALSSSAIQRYMTRNKLSPESVIEQYKTRNILYITGTKDSQNYLENMDEFELDAKELCGDEYSETKLFHKLDGAGHSEPSLTKSKIVQDFLWGKRQDNTVSIDTQPVSNVNIYTQKRTIVVENATKKIFVYDAIGRLIARRDARQFVSTINIKESGVYIVKIGNLTKKIFVE